MPLIVDKNAIRQEILYAFEKCIEDKPIENITLRDIAAKANMTHPKLLNYFESKEDLVLSYCEYAKDYMSKHCEEWFNTHDTNDYDSPLEYLNAFMSYVANDGTKENRPTATIQTYVLAKYNGKIEVMVKSEFQTWRKIMYKCLNQIYHNQISEDQAEAMMILITGTFVCNYTHALTGNINDKILSSFIPLCEKK